ncbi:hypothetical protein U1Q18_041184 [Sarracenia purpurea var. burkii]
MWFPFGQRGLAAMVLSTAVNDFVAPPAAAVGLTFCFVLLVYVNKGVRERNHKISAAFKRWDEMTYSCYFKLTRSVQLLEDLQ